MFLIFNSYIMTISSNNFGDYSLNDFIYSETANRFSIDNSLPEHLVSNAQLILLSLTMINKLSGFYHTITSGYRCDALNDKVGGISSSLHKKALAVDFIPHKTECHVHFSTTLRRWVYCFVSTLLPNTSFKVDVVYNKSKNYMHLEIQPIS